jgi:hypothetical protein
MMTTPCQSILVLEKVQVEELEQRGGRLLPCCMLHARASTLSTHVLIYKILLPLPLQTSKFLLSRDGIATEGYEMTDHR